MITCTKCTNRHYPGDDFCTDYNKVYDWDTDVFIDIDDC